MKSLLSLGVATSMFAALAGLPVPAQAAPATPMILQSSANAAQTNVVDVRYVRRPVARAYRGGYARGWRGGARYGTWRGNNWRGGPRYGYWRGGPRWGWGRPGWVGAGVVAGAAVGALAAAPYYGNCGYYSVPTWINGRRVWVQRYRCF